MMLKPSQRQIHVISTALLTTILLGVAVTFLATGAVAQETTTEDQDLTGYDEYDPGDNITVIDSNTYEYDNVTNANQAELYTDKHLRNGTELHFNTVVTHSSGGEIQVGFANRADFEDGDPYYLAGVHIGGKGGTNTIGPYWSKRGEQIGGSEYAYNITEGTRYYVSAYFTDQAVTVEVYNNSARTDLAGKNSIDFDPSPQYERFHAASTYDTPSGSADATLSGDVSDVTLERPPADLAGVVVDQNGDPVEDATVFTTEYRTGDPNVTTDLDELKDVVENGAPQEWFDQLDQHNGFGEKKFNADFGTNNFEETRVILHSDEDWETESIPRYYVVSNQIYDGKPPSDITARPVIDPDNEAVFACWEPDDSIGSDTIDSSIPGAATTDCEITIERVDPLGETLDRETHESKTVYEVAHWSNTGEDGMTLGGPVKKHQVVQVDLSQGMYRVYPDGNKEASLMYGVAPDGDMSKLKADIENVAERDASTLSAYEQEVKDRYDANEIAIQSTTTDVNGEFEIDVNTAVVEEAQVNAVKSGVELKFDERETRRDLEDQYDHVVRTNFREQAGMSIDDVESQSTLQDMCEQMDSVLDDAGVPYTGTAATSIPNDNVRVEGIRAIPSGLDLQIAECASINIASSIVENGFGEMLPGMMDDISQLSDSELDAHYERIVNTISANDQLCQEVADQVGASSCEDVLQDPQDATRDEKEQVIDEGTSAIDTISNGGGGGGSAPSAGSPDIGIEDPSDSDTVDETQDGVSNVLKAVWPVGNVDDWDEAEVLVRLHWSNGTTTTIDKSSEHLIIDERTARTDLVTLEYPIADTDPATVNPEIDVVTPGGVDSGDQGHSPVRNPAFSGDIPSLESLQVSKWSPGPSETVTVAANPRDETRFGSVKWMNVTGPNCQNSYQPSGTDVDIETCGAGAHRVEMTMTNPDGVEFVEVVQITAKATERGRPPSIRGHSGPTGRYAVVGDGLSNGRVDVTNGASEVELTAILPSDADSPSSVHAYTTGMDLASSTTTIVKIRRGQTEETIRRSIGVTIHMDELGDDALYYREGKPLPADGENREGSVEHTDDTTIVDTFTADHGSVEIRTVSSPGWFHSRWYNLRLLSPIDIGDAPLVMIDVPTLSVLLLVARRRDPPEPPMTAHTTQEATA